MGGKWEMACNFSSLFFLSFSLLSSVPSRSLRDLHDRGFDLIYLLFYLFFMPICDLYVTLWVSSLSQRSFSFFFFSFFLFFFLFFFFFFFFDVRRVIV